MHASTHIRSLCNKCVSGVVHEGTPKLGEEKTIGGIKCWCVQSGVAPLIGQDGHAYERLSEGQGAALHHRRPPSR